MISGLPNDDARRPSDPGRTPRGLLTVWAAGALIAVLALSLSWSGDGVNELLRFDRAGLGRGEAWRLVTGHVAHLDWQHAALNVVALALILVLFGPEFAPAGWLLIVVCSIALIDAGLWWFAPHVTWYVGLSGLLHGAVAAAAVASVMRRERMGIMLLVLIAAKLVWEQVAGPLPGSGSLIDGRIVTEAHLYGALGGALGALLQRWGRRAPL